VQLFNLTYRNIATGKGTTGNPETDLQMKIIMGDSSDNIPSVFPKCGPKTAQKCIDDPAFLLKKMTEKPEEYQKQYELNQLLVDFSKIPQELQKEFISSLRSPTN
jgi:5'-3' exonuclease